MYSYKECMYCMHLYISYCTYNCTVIVYTYAITGNGYMK